MDKTNYERKLSEILSDPDKFVKLNQDPSERIKKEINNQITQLNSAIKPEYWMKEQASASHLEATTMQKEIYVQLSTATCWLILLVRPKRILYNYSGLIQFLTLG